MENDIREKQRKSYVSMRMIYDVTMAILILGIGILLLLGDKFGVPALKTFLLTRVDSLIRYMFGGISILYGGFRLYRGIKSDY
jgi:hypothetical protein